MGICLQCKLCELENFKSFGNRLYNNVKNSKEKFVVFAGSSQTLM